MSLFQRKLTGRNYSNFTRLEEGKYSHIYRFQTSINYSTSIKFIAKELFAPNKNDRLDAAKFNLNLARPSQNRSARFAMANLIGRFFQQAKIFRSDGNSKIMSDFLNLNVLMCTDFSNNSSKNLALSTVMLYSGIDTKFSADMALVLF